MKWNSGLLKPSLPTLWIISRLDTHECSIRINPFPLPLEWGAPLCSGVWSEQTRCATTILEEPTQKASETEEVPQSVKCLPLAQHQTGKTPLEQVNRKFCAFLRTLSRVPLLDQGWKVQCRGKGMYGHQHWCSGGRGTDHTVEVRKICLIAISSVPSLHSRDC